MYKQPCIGPGWRCVSTERCE